MHSQLWEVRRGEFVLPSYNASRHISKMTMDIVIKRLGRSETVHGMRASFRTWAAEQTSFPREVIEVCLAHTVGDLTERSYQRGDLIDRRRRIMEAWSDFLSRPTDAAVIPLRR
jgi:integrase